MSRYRLYTVHHSCVRTIFSRRGEFSDHHTTRAYVYMCNLKQSRGIAQMWIPSHPYQRDMPGTRQGQVFCLWPCSLSFWTLSFSMGVRIFDGRECIVRERVRWVEGGRSGADYPNLTSGIPRKGYVCHSVVEFYTSQSNSLPAPLLRYSLWGTPFEKKGKPNNDPYPFFQVSIAPHKLSLGLLLDVTSTSVTNTELLSSWR